MVQGETNVDSGTELKHSFGVVARLRGEKGMVVFHSRVLVGGACAIVMEIAWRLEKQVGERLILQPPADWRGWELWVSGPQGHSGG